MSSDAPMPAANDAAISEQFAELAATYCALIHRALEVPPADLLREVHRQLPELYRVALTLPNVWVLTDEVSGEGEDDESDEATEATSDKSTDALPPMVAWMARWRRLGQHLGSANYYREMFSPYDLAEIPPVTGDLADDFLDIERDLQRGLIRWHEGDRAGATWEWQFHFAGHWGDHATSALRALHALAYDDLGGVPYTRTLGSGSTPTSD